MTDSYITNNTLTQNLLFTTMGVYKIVKITAEKGTKVVKIETDKSIVLNPRAMLEYADAIASAIEWSEKTD